MTPIEAFAAQIPHCEALGSPFTARLCRVIPAALTGPVGEAVRAWPGDPSPRADGLPLRLCGALHAVARTGRQPLWSALYRRASAATEAEIAALLPTVLAAETEFILARLASPPQTNELRRAAAFIAAAHFLRPSLPLHLTELGASAGLNLIWDRYALATPSGSLGPSDPLLTLTPEWRGAALSPADPVIADRAGIDLAPLDPVADRERLMSYIWADQSERLSRTARALDALAERPVPIWQGDAAEGLARRLATPTPEVLHLVQHSIAWQYFPPATAARCESLLEAYGARAPLARISMEGDGATPGAALTLWHWPGDGTRQHWSLGRICFHGIWLDWAPERLS